MPSNMIINCISLILLTNSQLLLAECNAKSGANTVPLLELYTSEGCSSCPPADKWLSSLPKNSHQFTPLAFHVDYWNYIGWQDRFSKAEYSDRQRQIAAYNQARFVYTPQFVLNGRDFKGNSDGRLKSAVAKHHNTPAAANLSLATSVDQGQVYLKATANLTNNQQTPSQVFIAIYQNKLVSNINAGENNGRELKHDYVVRELFGSFDLPTTTGFSKQLSIKPEWNNKDAGAVIFVQNTKTGEVLQSLALPFCGS